MPNFETQPSFEEKTPKEEFFSVIEQELPKMVRRGELTEEEAEEKRNSAALIEEGFSNNPQHDALMFLKTGKASEDEMLEMLQRRKANETTEED